MSLRSLYLSVKPGNWRVFTIRKSNSAFKAVCDQVLKRDSFTCQFCGFQASLYQEVVNLDEDYSNNHVDNLATACVFCTQCFFLDAIGSDEYGGGTLVYLPEFSQAELNGLCHVLFCAISNNTGYKSNAQTIYRSLKVRQQSVENKFGEGASQPAIFAQTLIESYSCTEETKRRLLSDLRLIPSHGKFVTQIEAWANAAVAAH